MKACVLTWILIGWAAAASARSGGVESYLAALNGPETRQAMRLKEVRRSERIANRLEVVFESGLSPTARSGMLRNIGSQFLRELFRWERIPVAVVVERNAAGRVIGSPTVQLSGAPLVGPDSVPQRDGSC